VKDVKLVGIDKQYSETVYAYIQRDIRPNSFINLFTYNLLNTSHGKYKEKKKNIGEAPNLLDSGQVEKSRTEIEEYLHSKGFFKAQVHADVEVKHKKAQITFTAERGPVFRFRNYVWEIPDTAVKRIYEENRNNMTRIHSGKRFDADSIQFEIDTIYALLRRKGYYDYLRQYGHMYVDTNLLSSQADLRLVISNPAGEDKHPVYTLDSTRFTIDNSEASRNRAPRITSVDSQHVFVDYTKRVRPKYIDRYLFLQRGDRYNTDKVNLTTDRLYDLNIFRSLRIDFEKTADSSNRLNSRISAIASKRMSNRIEAEYTFNSGRNGFNIGNTYTNKNLFGGGEQLNVKLRYGILFDSEQGAFSSVFNRDLQSGVSLVLPRLAVPFNIPLISRNGLPHTTISSGLQLFDQRNAFTNRIFTTSLTYDWVETKFKLHSLTPVNIEYRNGKFDPVFRETLQQNGYELYIRTNERSYISLGTQYAYTLNQAKLNALGNFFFLKLSTDLAGNTIALMSSALSLKKIDGSRTIFGLRYLQYAKGELDWRLYRSLGGERQFIVRLAPGVGYPYGNSREDGLPFEKNFYGGGSNGIRAWQARSLGPGQYNRATIRDELTRRNFRGLDQLGEIKLEGNIEYRWLLIRNFFGTKVKGAAFTDYGNIWRLRARDTVNNPGGTFRFNTFARQIAIGAGAGLRFDLDYFVFRFDVGAKIRDPQFVDPVYHTNPWVVKYLFNRKEIKDAYAITHKPDTYRFLQYNFGIGMPF
jgi:outer membrane protein assembly factor BamA